LLVCGVSAWPACYVGVVQRYTYHTGRLLTSFAVSGGSIGGSLLETASVVSEFDDPSVRLVLPEAWSDEQYDDNTSTIGAFAGCEARVLSGVVRSSEIATPVISFEGLVSFLGGSVAWSVGARRMFPGYHSWQQYLMRREGMAVATGCLLHTCLFSGTLDGQTVDVAFTPAVAGIGVPARFAHVCADLLLVNHSSIRIKACAEQRVCRDNLCAPQV